MLLLLYLVNLDRTQEKTASNQKRILICLTKPCFILKAFLKDSREEKIKDFSYQAMLVEYILTQIKEYRDSNKHQLNTRDLILYSFKKTLRVVILKNEISELLSDLPIVVQVGHSNQNKNQLE